MEQHTIDIEETEAFEETEALADETALVDETACIFRVHEGLRHANEKAYTPILISIGPYHRGRPKLCAMEKRKEHYLELLLQRNNKLHKDDYLDSMKKLEERARKYYVDSFDHLDSDEFVKMMLYDACFVIEFLFGLHEFFVMAERQQSHVGDEVKVLWKRRQICTDLMLLENQLPFFVISKFYYMSYGMTVAQNANQNHPDPSFNPTLNPNSSPKATLMILAMPIVFQNIPGQIDIFNIDLKKASVFESKHFLDLAHNIFLPSSSSSSTSDKSNDHQNKNQRTHHKLPCVMELKDAGVKFQAVENDDDELNLNMFDIRFEHGHFKIPTFSIGNDTETFFRNIIAYEQHSSSEDNGPKYFSDYTYFMDKLINTKEDVNELCRNEVLDNWLGDDEEVALMFNNLRKGAYISDNFYYAEQCCKVNAHCERWWNRVVASLNRDYFTNIWVTVTTVAAAFLLLLTITQTVIALITIIISPPSRH